MTSERVEPAMPTPAPEQLASGGLTVCCPQCGVCYTLAAKTVEIAEQLAGTTYEALLPTCRGCGVRCVVTQHPTAGDSTESIAESEETTA